jgi:rhamnosyltransferase
MMTLVQHGLPRSAKQAGLASLGVIVPTLNAEGNWQALQSAIDAQGISPEQVLVIDSSSTDRTRTLAREAGYQVFRIPKQEFNHGGTRQLALWHMPRASVLLYLTQDAIPASRHSFARLFAAFSDPEVGAAYGRQLPREGADPIERHARLFNYPADSAVRTLKSRDELGIKAAFLSNSFAAYRRSALEKVGGFPTDVLMAEDSVVAARMLLAGIKIAYCADATVIHSHPLSLRAEFTRYFDTGVHHARERWIRQEFGGAGGEGLRFVRSELRYLLSHQPWRIPVAMLRAASKFFAFRLGLQEAHLPLGVKRSLSHCPDFWKNHDLRSARH